MPAPDLVLPAGLFCTKVNRCPVHSSMLAILCMAGRQFLVPALHRGMGRRPRAVHAPPLLLMTMLVGVGPATASNDAAAMQQAAQLGVAAGCLSATDAAATHHCLQCEIDRGLPVPSDSWAAPLAAHNISEASSCDGILAGQTYGCHVCLPGTAVGAVECSAGIVWSITACSEGTWRLQGRTWRSGQHF